MFVNIQNQPNVLKIININCNTQQIVRFQGLAKFDGIDLLESSWDSQSLSIVATIVIKLKRHWG